MALRSGDGEDVPMMDMILAPVAVTVIEDVEVVSGHGCENW